MKYAGGRPEPQEARREMRACWDGLDCTTRRVAQVNGSPSGIDGGWLGPGATRWASSNSGDGGVGSLSRLRSSAQKKRCNDASRLAEHYFASDCNHQRMVILKTERIDAQPGHSLCFACIISQDSSRKLIIIFQNFSRVDQNAKATCIGCRYECDGNALDANEIQW